MNHVPLSLALALVVPIAGTSAQRPDFSGVWTLDSPASDNRPSVATRGDASFRVGDMGSGWGSRLTIARDGARLTVEYVFFGTYDLQPPLKYAYALDGSESVNRIMIGHATSVQRSRTAWRGDTLVITTSYPAPLPEPGQRVEVHQALVLDSPTRLTITTTRGGSGSASVTRAVYTKG